MLRDMKAKSASGRFLPPKGRSDVIKFIITSRSSRNIMNYAKVLSLCGATILMGINKNGTARGAILYHFPLKQVSNNPVPYGAV